MPLSRRSLVIAALSAPIVATGNAWAGGRSRPASTAREQLGRLETAADGRLGVALCGSDGHMRLDHRAEERFPMCSTFKVLAAAALLRQSEQDGALLQRRVRYGRDDLVAYSVVTEKHVDEGMTIAELCAATLRYPDNTAANLLMKELGGPQAVTAFARALGDTGFRIDRWETELNSAVPGDVRDTTTPDAMARTLHKLVLGNALAPRQREQLREWMLGSTTGAERIRAGVPADWRVADKTGGGGYGTTNDIAVLWPPNGKPLVLTVYFTQKREKAPGREDVVAEAARIALA